jgi:hypothetical protein
MKALASQKAEIEDAKKLSQEIEFVVARLNQLVERFKIKEARKLCASGPIARQLTARRRVILTKSLKTQLTEELDALQLSHIPINLSDRSAGAESVVEVGLTAHQRVAKIAMCSAKVNNERLQCHVSLPSSSRLAPNTAS